MAHRLATSRQEAIFIAISSREPIALRYSLTACRPELAPGTQTYLVMHGTKMFVNLPNETDRQNVIAYPHTLKK